MDPMHAMMYVYADMTTFHSFVVFAQYNAKKMPGTIEKADNSCSFLCASRFIYVMKS